MASKKSGGKQYTKGIQYIVWPAQFLSSTDIQLLRLLTLPGEKWLKDGLLHARELSDDDPLGYVVMAVLPDEASAIEYYAGWAMMLPDLANPDDRVVACYVVESCRQQGVGKQLIRRMCQAYRAHCREVHDRHARSPIHFHTEHSLAARALFDSIHNMPYLRPYLEE